MNTWCAVGRITKEIEEPKIYQKDDVTNMIIVLRIAVASNKKNVDSDFFNIKAFGKQADYIYKTYNLGDLLSIRCRICNSNYEKDGKTVYKNDYILEKVDRILKGNISKEKSVNTQF